MHNTKKAVTTTLVVTAFVFSLSDGSLDPSLFTFLEAIIIAVRPLFLI